MDLLSFAKAGFGILNYLNGYKNDHPLQQQTPHLSLVIDGGVINSIM